MKSRKLKMTMLLLPLFIIITMSSQIVYTQNESGENDNTEEEKPIEEIVQEELEILVENYNEVVKENEGWNAEYEIISKIKEHIDNNFHNPRAYEALVKFYYKNGPKSLARKYGQKAIDVSNKLKEIYFTRDIIYYIGLYYLNKSTIDYGRALGYFNVVNAMGNDDISAKAELFYNIGVCYYNLFMVREIDEDMRFVYLSESAFEFSVYLEPNIESLYDLGKVYIILGKYEEAMNSFDRALEINPSIEKVIEAKEELLNIIPKSQD
jgi:tetratricopeptide (TPR) repeat protein